MKKDSNKSLTVDMDTFKVWGGGDETRVRARVTHYRTDLCECETVLLHVNDRGSAHCLN